MTLQSSQGDVVNSEAQEMVEEKTGLHLQAHVKVGSHYESNQISWEGHSAFLIQIRNNGIQMDKKIQNPVSEHKNTAHALNFFAIQNLYISY